MIRTVDHGAAGALKLVASPLKLAGTPVIEPTPPPLLGQHTESALRALLHYSPAAIEDLRAAGAISAPAAP